VRRAQRNGIGDLLWRSADRFPDKTAIVYRNIRQTYAQLDETVNRMANALTERGIRKGDRIALLSHNNHGVRRGFLRGCADRGDLVPINFMLNATEVAYILGHAKPVAMVVEDGLLPVAESALHIAELDVLTRGVILEASATPPDGWQSVADWMLHADARSPDTDIDDDEPVNILYTSGTESRPKGATLSSRNLITQYLSQIVDGEMSTEDVEVHALPLFHCAQLHVFLVPDIYIGATSIVLPGADPRPFWRQWRQERATKLFCPPTVWIALLRHPDFDRRDLSSLRKGYYGASIMPVEVIKELAGRLPRMRLFNLYGQTEMSPLATVLKPEGSDAQTRLCGACVAQRGDARRRRR
jgi:fatty-acyl-CoA synthase